MRVTGAFRNGNDAVTHNRKGNGIIFALICARHARNSRDGIIIGSIRSRHTPRCV